jgi:arsenate reductase
VKFYGYDNCDTCRKAAKFLKARSVPFASIAIREKPPQLPELRRALEFHGGNLRKLFNTSGRDYKELKIADRLETLSESDALKMLASNGNLVKRPFVVDGNRAWCGFNEATWIGLLGR